MSADQLWDQLSQIERETLIERLRQSGLRLDGLGRWWHDGEPIAHRRLSEALHRWLERLDDGRYVVRLDDTRYAYVEVDEAPYFVRSLREAEGLLIKLSDQTEEPLEIDSLAVGPDQAFFCRVKSGRFRAKFLHGAQQLLARYVDQDADGHYVVEFSGRRYPIATTAG